MKRYLSALAVAVGLLATATPARAVPITMTISGTIASADSGMPAPWSGVVAGDEFSYTFTFESTTAPQSSSTPTRGNYFGFVTAATLRIGNATATESTSIYPSNNQASVLDGNDGVDVFTSNVSFETYSVSFGLQDNDASAFSSTALPLAPVPLALLEDASFTFSRGGAVAFGTITSWTLVGPAAGVPEPATLALAGIAGLAAVRNVRARRGPHERSPRLPSVER